jgi:hypothetical protein
MILSLCFISRHLSSMNYLQPLEVQTLGKINEERRVQKYIVQLPASSAVRDGDGNRKICTIQYDRFLRMPCSRTKFK